MSAALKRLQADPERVIEALAKIQVADLFMIRDITIAKAVKVSGWPWMETQMIMRAMREDGWLPQPKKLKRLNACARAEIDAVRKLFPS